MVTYPRALTLREGGSCGRTITAGDANPGLTQIGGSGSYADPACGVAGSWFFDRQ